MSVQGHYELNDSPLAVIEFEGAWRATVHELAGDAKPPGEASRAVHWPPACNYSQVIARTAARTSKELWPPACTSAHT